MAEDFLKRRPLIGGLQSVFHGRRFLSRSFDCVLLSRRFLGATLFFGDRGDQRQRRRPRRLFRRWKLARISPHERGGGGQDCYGVAMPYISKHTELRFAWSVRRRSKEAEDPDSRISTEKPIRQYWSGTLWGSSLRWTTARWGKGHKRRKKRPQENRLSRHGLFRRRTIMSLVYERKRPFAYRCKLVVLFRTLLTSLDKLIYGDAGREGRRCRIGYSASGWTIPAVLVMYVHVSGSSLGEVVGLSKVGHSF